MMRSLVKTSIVFALAIAVACVFAVSQAQAADYVGVSQCKICHNKKDEGEQFKKWSEAKHSKAFETLKSPESLKIGEAKGLEKPPAESPECLKCHTTAYDVEKKAVPEKIKLEDSVSCEHCHGPGSDHVAAGKKVLFSKDTTIDMSATQEKVTAETCVKCHNDESPTWNPEKYTKEDGTKVGFDFDQAFKKIDHSNPKKKAAEGG